jgi:hypothetical protein
MPSSNWTRVVIGLAAALWVLVLFLSGHHLQWWWGKPLGLVAGLVVCLLLAYDKWVWRWPGICRLTRRPVLHGTWRTELQTSHDARKEESIECYLVIDQTYSRICTRMLFDRSESQSMSGDIVYENSRCTLYYIFRSEKRTLERDGNPPSRGGAELRVRRTPKLELEGDYWTEERTAGHIVTTGYSSRTFDGFADARTAKYR